MLIIEIWSMTKRTVSFGILFDFVSFFLRCLRSWIIGDPTLGL